MAFDTLASHHTAQQPVIEERESIPSPKGLPLLGNLLDVQNEVPIHGLEHLADIYGPIFKLNLFGRERITVANVELIEEICDEKRFWKTPGDGLTALRTKRDSRYGLFSAPTEDSMDWQQAHRTLMPAFGPLSIQHMFGEMHDIASQLVLKWARKGPSYRIPVTLDFTRLTLDTIALCAMDYRFNSFYQDDMHPFVEAMTVSLAASSDRLKIGAYLRKLLPWDKSAENLQHARQYMGKISRELVQLRRDNPTSKHDLLNAMIHGKDPKTGNTMDDELIASNMTTFLIAGHETTSGLLSFAMVNLLQSPEAYFKAQQEVDHVLGRSKMTVDHLKDLHYINAVLRETLRLTPTAPAFSRSIRGDNPSDVEPLLGGKYAIRRDDKILCLITKAQRDPKVYGEDANEFKPERMLEDNFQRLPKGAWKPFGSGVRACIGRPFAWQEAQMVLALILQNFNFTLDDPGYQLKVKQTLTIKPEGFYMRATLREGVTALNLHALLSGQEEEMESAMSDALPMANGSPSDGKPMTVLYGSNTGTCQSLAQKLSVEARRRGFSADVKEMNAAVGVLPRGQPVAIITASYEGQPTDNGDQFVTWLEKAATASDFDNVQYAVFGCGHSDWKSTFHRIPRLVDELMEERGGKRLVQLGLTDAAHNSIFSDFDNWTDGVLWPALAPGMEATMTPASALDVEMSTQDRSSYLRQDVQRGSIVDARILTAPGEPEKRHLEVKLPDGQSYETGDYLAILPMNPLESVSRTMRHFQVPQDATIKIKSGSATFLPTGVRLSVQDLLRGYVELSQPMTRRDLQACIAATEHAGEKESLTKLLAEEEFTELTKQRISLLDTLCKYRSVGISFASFLSMLPPLRPRHYSISSSPLHEPTKCTITFGVIDDVALSGFGRFIGVTSTYLSTLQPGDDVLVSVRATNKFFHLPADPDTCPILMLGAGSGLAPFRGFIQERAIQQAAGRQLAPALLFMGCRSSSRDRLYADELDKWARAGVVEIRYAFSKEPQRSDGCKYVQDRMLKDKEDVLQMWRDGAKVFVCGGPDVSAGIGDAAKILLRDSRKKQGEEMTEGEAEEWFQLRRNERYVVDVFA